VGCAESYQGVIYLGTEWSSNPVVRSDIVVSHFLDSVGGYRHKERRDRLLGILDVDLDWYVPTPVARGPPQFSLSARTILTSQAYASDLGWRAQTCPALYGSHGRVGCPSPGRGEWFGYSQQHNADEQVTVDLDVLVRADLLAFLIEESKVRKATIVCASVLSIPPPVLRIILP
jgi:CCR4-NOT complex subunit CAF16